jgi:NDP-sugar pyrophosphorylase family protein
MDELVGLILAGGLGTRMRPFTLHTPKCLIEVDGRPFLDFQLELFAKNKVDRVVLSTGYLGHKIEDHIKSHGSHGIDVAICHEKEQLGTGGAIINSLGKLPEEFFLSYGDSYLLQPFAPVRSAFKKSKKSALMTVLYQTGGTAENNCEVLKGSVVRYQKGQPKGTFDYMEYGLVFFKKKALKKYPQKNFSTDMIFWDLISRRELAAFETRAPYYEVGSKQGLRGFTQYIKNMERI